MFNLSQEEFDDEDDWNPCKAAGVCLMLIAQCCEDDILTYVIDFITANIEREDWKSKDAAVMAFGEFKSFHIHLQPSVYTSHKSLTELGLKHGIFCRQKFEV